MSYRVVQWATGNVGRAAIEGVLDHPDLEVAGCWVHSTDKEGVDVGTLAEFFRTWPGTVTSACPAVRIGAGGARADWLVGEHVLDFPFGRRTPFEKLV